MLLIRFRKVIHMMIRVKKSMRINLIVVKDKINQKKHLKAHKINFTNKKRNILIKVKYLIF